MSGADGDRADNGAYRGGHREIDHTADLGFELWAETLEGLYAEGVAALGEICYDRAAVRPHERRELVIEGANLEERLVRWLQDVYLLLESELWLARQATDVATAGDEVRGVLWGEPFDAQRHTLHTEIKAITYHGLEIVHDDDRWRTTVVVDV
jgi:SHS2 domain-containing protein